MQVSDLKEIDFLFDEIDFNYNSLKCKGKGKLSLLQPAAQGSFYCIDFDEHLTKWNQIYHVAMPTGYTIKMKKDNVNIPVDDYNLCDKPIVLKCVCNEEMIVSVTNQNMILIWKK